MYERTTLSIPVHSGGGGAAPRPMLRFCAYRAITFVVRRRAIAPRVAKDAMMKVVSTTESQNDELLFVNVKCAKFRDRRLAVQILRTTEDRCCDVV